MFERIHHIGIAVVDLTAAKTIYSNIYGLKEGAEDVVPNQGVRIKVYCVENAKIELLEPLHRDTPVGKFLEKRGPGIHHIAYKVDNIRKALEQLKAAGVNLIDERPRMGALGTKIAFLHPSSTGGVLTEIVEDHPENP